MSDPVKNAPTPPKAKQPAARDSATAAKAAPSGMTNYGGEIERLRSPLTFTAVWFGLPLVVIILIEALHLFGH